MHFQVFLVCVAILFSNCCVIDHVDVSNNQTNSTTPNTSTTNSTTPNTSTTNSTTPNTSTTNSISRATNSSTTNSPTTSLSTEDEGSLALKDLEEQLIMHDTRIHTTITGLRQQMKDLLISHRVLEDRFKATSKSSNSTTMMTREQGEIKTDYPCKDDPQTDCARLQNVLQICNKSFTQQARTLCIKFCGYCDFVDGNWSDWDDWSDCSISCGGGTQIRSRTCDNPEPTHGGYNCTGKKTQHRSCNIEECPDTTVRGNWSDWTSWSACSATCGISMQSRTRNCDNPPPGPAGQYCAGSNVDHKMCMASPCAAFHAQMSSSTKPSNGQTVQFGVETIDVGSGYNPRTSIYTVPLTGVYSFSWTIRISGSAWYGIELVVNNDVKNSLMTYSNIDVSTATTVVSVNAGDRVSIRVQNRSGGPSINSGSNGRSTFSGWILN